MKRTHCGKQDNDTLRLQFQFPTLPQSLISAAAIFFEWMKIAKEEVYKRRGGSLSIGARKLSSHSQSDFIIFYHIFDFTSVYNKYVSI